MTKWQNILKKLSVFVFVIVGFFASMSALAQQSYVVDPNWLKEQIATKQPIVIFDSRSKEEYDQGHIPNAISFPVDDTYVVQDRAYYVKNKVNIAPLLREKGVTKDAKVIVYDQGELMFASRLLWVLELYGIKDLAILNGGIDGWKENNDVSQVAHSLPVSDYVPVLNPSIYASTTVAKVAVHNPKYNLYDSRTYDEYLGKKSVTSKYGRIPKAKYIDLSKFFTTDENGKKFLKSQAELDEVLSQLDKTKKNITYCNKGTASTLSYYLLKQAGFNVAHYDGSWIDWSEKGLPIEK
ncbi:sulfurtransferase [Photobacterium leiognathi]|uniref:sulfurtransferase n=1 Tax=Photobacterium leiognathi TaxID=553611 RepID=UPI00020883D1|nr:rhodanese-like domain-containing protein [Photobacterium leiognathi]PSW53421.1 sulfurtransferase [Photobacterium leiognathi subsp. mandapamensis]GAA04006.1 rhodanese-like domain protein [Photobacterium leiognathi subsp. mandapamensis svers.1.1.]